VIVSERGSAPVLGETRHALMEGEGGKKVPNIEYEGKPYAWALSYPSGKSRCGRS